MDDSIRKPESGEIAPRPGLLAPLDPATTLAGLAGQINDEHRRGQQSALVALEHGLRAGQGLLRVKSQLPHGGFQAWVAEHCLFSYRSAANYMKLARDREKGGVVIDRSNVQPPAPSALERSPMPPRRPRPLAISGPVLAPPVPSKLVGPRAGPDRDEGRSGAAASQPVNPVAARWEDFARLTIGDLVPDLMAKLEGCPTRSLLRDPAAFDRAATLVYLARALRARDGTPPADRRRLFVARYLPSAPSIEDLAALARDPSQWPPCECCRGEGVEAEDEPCPRCSGDGFSTTRLGEELELDWTGGLP